MPEDLKAEADIIADGEGDFTGLVIEGVARVVEDRKNDPEYLAAHPEVRDRLAARIQDQIDGLQAELEAIVPSE